MNRSERHQVIPAVFLVFERNAEILLQRRFNTGFQDGQYTLPSGHVEQNETPTQAACREAAEETGVSVKPEDIKFEQVLYRRGFNDSGDGFNRSQPERVDFFFSTRKWKGNPMITEPDKCDDLSWFPLNALPNNLFPVVRTFLGVYPKKNRYQESGY